VKRIRNGNTGTSAVVDGCSDKAKISQVFLRKYRKLYKHVPYDAAEMQGILTDVESQISREAALSSDHICSPQEVASAISKLNPHKNDGGTGLSSDHFIFAGPDLPVYIAFLFTCITVHGCMPEDLLPSSVIPVPKKRGCNASASENFRGIACFIRTLVYMYFGHSVHVLWASISSTYFQALNGVKQEGVISPVLFCIYIDDLLKRLSASGVGCCLGSNFVGDLAYADHIVLVAPTPFAMRKMRMIGLCDMYALQYDIIFNAQKSKFLVIGATCWRSLYASMCKCFFSSVVIKLRTWTPFRTLVTLLIPDSQTIETYYSGVVHLQRKQIMFCAF